jgi:hypothetical protein
VKITAVQHQDKYSCRAHLWKDFKAEYQMVLATDPDGFSNYCAQFRELWLAANTDKKLK